MERTGAAAGHVAFATEFPLVVAATGGIVVLVGAVLILGRRVLSVLGGMMRA